MQYERGLVKVGMEVEVVKWKGRTFQSVCKDLVDQEYMYGPTEIWQEHHQYHCTCEQGGCGIVRRGDLVIPPIVSMTYDASLPKSGAEFIISPILLVDEARHDDLNTIWQTITDRAVWDDTLTNYHSNGLSSPSVHLHVSAQAVTGNLPERTRPVKSFVDDIFHALSLFTPELFTLADSAGLRRGLTYRLPTREAVEYDKKHHGFIDVLDALPEYRVYLEWRMFEAAYHDWQYIETAIYMAAALTRGFLQPEIISRFMATGYARPFSAAKVNSAIKDNRTELLLELVDRDRFEALREICTSQIDDDHYGFTLINNLFDKVGRTL